MLNQEKAEPPKFRKLRSSEVRPALIEAGVKLLSSRSIDAIKIDEIVKTAGVARGSFYYHFDNRKAFAGEVLRLIREDVDALAAETNANVSDPVRRLVRGICSSYQFAMTHPDQAKILIRVNANVPHVGNTVNEGLLADLQYGVDQGSFDIPNMEAALLNALGIVALVLQQMLRKPMALKASRKLCTDSIHLMLRGFDVDDTLARKAAKEEVAIVLVGKARR